MSKRLCFHISFLLLSACAMQAQTSGTIVGNVRDATGAQISGATVTVTNTEIDGIRVITTAV